MVRSDLSEKGQAVYDLLEICQRHGIKSVYDIPALYDGLEEMEKMQLTQMLIESTLLQKE